MKLRQFVSGAAVLAVLAVEAVSWGWQWYLTRYFFTAVLADVAVVCVLKYTTETLWPVDGLKDAALLSLYVTLLYSGLQAPHEVSGSLLYTILFLISAAHKFIVCFVILVILQKIRC
uniref:Uncharacterized protein LOC111099788 n=1 Tax=Crassostrea virginica TaxID=6565 RepID=A0A8B8A719_CRAVI|nr:uncharacterized protein LOC111099788 [Crassostrea virginica]